MQSIGGIEDDLCSINFINDSTFLITGDNGLILRSTDKGINWDRKPIIRKLTINRIQFINDSIGWLACDHGIILKTTDAGYTWFKLNKVTDNNLFSLNFLNEKIGWVV